ncbi:MAG: exodeoxyribonuclease V subunit gamma [Desulfocapsaceae bacterium]
MFFLHSSNRTENLAGQLAEVIDQSGTPSLFRKTLFLVQSRGMERMLSQYLADTFGVWGNSAYLLPMQFIDYLCNAFKLEMDSSSFDRRVLTWRLEQLLRRLDDPVMGSVAHYLGGEQGEIKRFQLARKIGDLFDQYQIMRPDYIAAWDAGRRATANSEEVWQAHLWRQLRATHSAPHRGEIIGALIKYLEQGQSSALLNLSPVYVFGLHTLPPLFMAALNAFSSQVDVHFFLLSPCAEYWADMESKRARLKRGPDAVQLSLPGLSEISLADTAHFHPLLESLGRQGADFQDLLLDYVEDITEGSETYESSTAHPDRTLLQRLQDDLLEGQTRESRKGAGEVASDDSVMIVSAHSKSRELAILKDYILDWLYQDPALGLHDILVMAPDIQDYADLIPAFFNDVAYDTSDCRTRRDNPYFEIFLQFLELFTSRYTMNDVLGLLEHPELAASFSISLSDLDLIRHWGREAGVRWGISERQRAAAGLYQDDPGTWQNGLERMLLGLASGSTDPVGELLPYDEIEGSNADLLGSLCRFVELIEYSRQIFIEPMTLKDWAAILGELTVKLFGEDDSQALLELQNQLAELAEVYAAHHAEQVVFEVIHCWLKHQAEATSHVGFLRGRLTFCSMLPMRSIPFKVICLLGLNNGGFPKQDDYAPFDLLTCESKKGDRSRRADDRYQFLEAILAARRTLYISYIGQSVRTNDALPPSPVVAELSEIMQTYYGAEVLRRHPLQPFSASYYSGQSGLFSYSEYHCSTARALREVPVQPPHCWLAEPLPEQEQTEVGMAELARFVVGPQLFFARDILGLKTRLNDNTIEDHEPFTLDSLEHYILNQDLVEALRSGRDPNQLLAELQGSLHWPLAFPGRQLFKTAETQLSAFVQKLEEFDPGRAVEAYPFELEVDRFRLSGVIENRYENGLLLYRYTSLKGKDLLYGWLCHLIVNLVNGGNISTTIAAQDRSLFIDGQAGTRQDLLALLELYQQGCRFPSELYLEPALAYCEQIISNRATGKKDPLQKACETLTRDLKMGYAPELEILFPGADAAALLDERFVKLCNDFFLGIRDRVAVAKG